MRTPTLLMAALVATLVPDGGISAKEKGAGSRSAEPACEGKLSGAVSASFPCVVTLLVREDGTPILTITATKTLEGIPSYVPGAFEIPAPPRAGTYTLGTLGMGRAVVAVEGGSLFTATKTTSQRGEVTLVLSSIVPVKDAWTVHGSYRARLLPAASARKDDVVIDVRF